MKKSRMAIIVATWLVYYLLIELPLMLVGIFVVGYLAHGMKWKTRYSDIYKGRSILVWNAGSWAWIFGNEEDGIDGLPREEVDNWRMVLQPRQQWWWDKTAKWSSARRVFVWAGLRNSVSNLRFTRLAVAIDPARVRSYDFSPQHTDGPRRWWCWQGVRGRLHYETQKYVLEIGWKLRLEDSRGIAPDDSRAPGAGFGLRLKRRPAATV